MLVPCLDEAVAIAQVVADFRAALPAATIYVYDNGSNDDTAKLAAAAGAVVRREPMPGKGNVVRRMFQDVEADLYLMVDGDGTYDARVAPALVERLLADQLDMVVGRRIETGQGAFRAGHRLGNRVLTGLVARLFGAPLGDMLSGYRVVSQRFAKSFTSSAREFEIETELTVHALQLRMATAELDANYIARGPASASKLRTWHDGWQILVTITNLLRNERPLLFFALIALVLAGTAAALGVPLILEYFDTGLVRRFPTAILCSGIGVISALCLVTGLILDLVGHVRRESKRLAYLQHPAPGLPRR